METPDATPTKHAEEPPERSTQRAEGELRSRLASLGATRSRVFVRNLAAEELLELFMVMAVSAVILIRFLLELSGYPQLGGAGLHIAHLLWGGLLMLLALLLLLAYLGHRIQRLAAVLGGLGFGIFVDELGKFITSDNNYFYRPTMALIYLIFVALFLVLRALGRQRQWSEETYLINALAELQEAVLHDLDAVEHRRARALLQRVKGTPNPLAEHLSALFDALTPIERRRTSPLQRLVRQARRRAHRALSSRWLPRLVSLVFFLRGLGFLLTVVVILAGYATSNGRPTNTELIAFAAALLSNVMGIFGVVSLLRSRLTAFAWFKRSVLLSIFVADVFAFYQQQLAAVFSLAIDVALFVVLSALLRHELAHRGAARADVTAPVTSREA